MQSSFIPLPNRDAWATIRGYVYQAQLTISRWLDLQQGQVLELERGEDIDLVFQALTASDDIQEQERQIEQVKHRSSSHLTLRQPEAIEALVNAFEHRSTNPNVKLLFRYTTNASIGRERNGSKIQGIPAIQLWEQVRQGYIPELELHKSLSNLRNLLRDANRPSQTSKLSWKKFLSFLNESDDDQLLAFIQGFEWSTKTTDASQLHSVLCQRLIDEHYATSDGQAQRQYDRLFVYVLRKLSSPGLKQLTVEDRNLELSLPPLNEADQALLDTVMMSLSHIESRLNVLEHEHTQQNLVISRIDTQVTQLITENDSSRKAGVPNKPIFHVPYRRNPFFTGREDILRDLHSSFPGNSVIAITQTRAISGLGGIGKTQIILEYVYRYRDEYQTVIWINADASQTLEADFAKIADLLNLPQKNEGNLKEIIEAVKRWLNENTDWLLVIDNIESTEIAHSYLPLENRGHVLITTRDQATGSIARHIQVDQFSLEEGALFLLRRAKFIKLEEDLSNASEANNAKAKKISEVLFGLPLALEQAAAFIEETQCDLSSYLKYYQTQHTELLKRQSRLTVDYPYSVVTTWSLSLEKIQLANPYAVELLQLFAFLHPDSIPLEIIPETGIDKGNSTQSVMVNPLKVEEAIAELLKYSLLHRNTDTQTLSIHRLVQLVIKDAMTQDTQHQWAERAVRAVNQMFPDVESTNWERCMRYLPHARECVELIDRWEMEFPEATRLMDQTGCYLRDRAEHISALLLLTSALTIRERNLGLQHPDVAASLHHLANLYTDQAMYKQAEPLYHQAISILQQAFGPEAPNVGDVINNLALLFWNQGKYAEAEQLYKQVLFIYQPFGPEYPNALDCLNNLATLYHDQGKYAEAEQLYLQTIQIGEKTLGSDHPDLAPRLNNLATLYYDLEKYLEAEPLFLRTLDIRKKTLGPEHPEVAATINNLALLYHDQGNYEKAETLYQQALAIRKRSLNPNHPDIANSLDMLGEFYRDQGMYEQAEPLYKQALAICEQVLGPYHASTGNVLNNLALLNSAQGKYLEAESLYQKSLEIFEKAKGPNHLHLATVLKNYARLLRKMNQENNAQDLELRVREIEALSRR